jgi:cytoskeletal protein RodZ
MLISTRIFYVVLSVLSVVLMITFVQNYVGENSLEQIFVYGLENAEHDMNIHHNYVQITTQGDNTNHEVTEGLCNKLLESCATQNTDSATDDDEATTEQDNTADDISEKYFEQPDQEITASPLTSFQAGQNATNAIGIIGQPQLLNQTNATLGGNFTQAETGFENFTGGNFTQAETGFETYEDPILGFSILQPSGWQKVENNTERYSAITLVSPQESTPDPVIERLVLRINNIPTNFTLDDYSMRVRDALEKNSNFSVINFNSTVLSGNPAYGVIGIENEGGKNVDVIDKWTIKDGIVYRIVFYSDNAKSSIYMPMGQKMIDSFSITR